MWPIVTDQVPWSVDLSHYSPVKTAEPIEMPFGLKTREGPRNHVLDEVQIMEWAILKGGRGIPL